MSLSCLFCCGRSALNPIIRWHGTGPLDPKPKSGDVITQPASTATTRSTNEGVGAFRTALGTSRFARSLPRASCHLRCHHRTHRRHHRYRRRHHRRHRRATSCGHRCNSTRHLPVAQSLWTQQTLSFGLWGWSKKAVYRQNQSWNQGRSLLQADQRRQQSLRLRLLGTS
jgi:hypothetical protein